MKTVKDIIGTVIVSALLIVIAGLVFLYSGVYDIGATAKHTSPTLWAINTLRRNSVATHARGIDAPPLDNKRMIRTGFAHYRENCVRCHAAPGVEAFEGAKDMYPKPPNLADSARKAPPAQLFWVIKHGLKMTGMPAWGYTHSDDKIWAMVAFLRQLPAMSAADYQRLDASVKPGEDHHHGTGHDHDHGSSDPPLHSQ